MIGETTTDQTQNAYTGFVEEEENMLRNLKEKIHEQCDNKRIGMFDFLLVDITDSAMLKSIWHDGWY